VALKLKEYRSSFDRGPALADYLPYDSHDDGAFILKDGSLGMMWSLATITEEGLSEEERDRVRVAIEGVVMRIPAELACQIILCLRHGLNPCCKLSFHRQPCRCHDKLFLIAGWSHPRGAPRTVFPERRGVPAEDTLDLLHHSLLLGWQKPGLADFLVGPGSTGLLKIPTRPPTKGEEKVRTARRFVEAYLAEPAGPKPVSPQELISVLYPILNPVRANKLGEPLPSHANHLRTGCSFHHERAAAGLKCEE
jgi:hypothetical protein